MLSKVKTLKGYSIQGTEGEKIGTVKDFYFDDRHWTVRYLVAHTGNWLSGRQVLVSPYGLVSINHDQQDILTDLTKSRLKKVLPWTVTSPFPANSRMLTMVIMAGRIIGAVNTRGARILILSAIATKGTVHSGRESVGSPLAQHTRGERLSCRRSGRRYRSR